MRVNVLPCLLYGVAELQTVLQVEKTLVAQQFFTHSLPLYLLVVECSVQGEESEVFPFGKIEWQPEAYIRIKLVVVEGSVGIISHISAKCLANARKWLHIPASIDGVETKAVATFVTVVGVRKFTLHCV